MIPMRRWTRRGERIALPVLFALVVACGDDPQSRIGEVCEAHDDCVGELGEYCSRVYLCVASCGGGCPSGSHCVRVGEREVCLKACIQDDECQKLQRCGNRYAPGGYSSRRVCVLENSLAVQGPHSYE